MAKPRHKRGDTPANQATGAGNGGVVPPVHSRFAPGRSGNPAGRPPAGLTVKEYINTLAAGDLTEDELRAVAKGKKEPWAKRTAAMRMIRALESGDIADFEDLLNGSTDLKALRERGINTDIVKKLKQKSRVVPSGDGDTETVIEREIELHDRSGDDFDRIFDRTIGKPSQAVDVTSKGESIYLKDIKGVSADDL